MKLLCVRGRQQEYEDADTQHRYWSVSEVLTVLDPEAFNGIDPFVLATAQQRGSNLHVLFALRLLAEKGIGAPPKPPEGIIGKYYAGIEQFVRERKPKPRKVEQSSLNDVYKYAGTLDTESTLDDLPDAWVIDLKTGPERAVHSAQLHAYKHLKGHEKAKRLGSLYIRKNGTYRLVEHTHNHVDLAWFHAGLTVLNGRRHHQIR